MISALFHYGSGLHRPASSKRRWKYIIVVSKSADDWRAKVYHHLGVAYRAVGENHKAAEWYQKSYDIEPNPNTLKDLLWLSWRAET